MIFERKESRCQEPPDRRWTSMPAPPCGRCNGSKPMPSLPSTPLRSGTVTTFGAWCQDQQIAERMMPLHICAAFKAIGSRIAPFRAAGSAEPIRTVRPVSLAKPPANRSPHALIPGPLPAHRRARPDDGQLSARCLIGGRASWEARSARLHITHPERRGFRCPDVVRVGAWSRDSWVARGVRSE